MPATADFTIKVTEPLAFDAPDAAEMVSLAPREEASVTVLPDIGFE